MYVITTKGRQVLNVRSWRCTMDPKPLPSGNTTLSDQKPPKKPLTTSKNHHTPIGRLRGPLVSCALPWSVAHSLGWFRAPSVGSRVPRRFRAPSVGSAVPQLVPRSLDRFRGPLVGSTVPWLVLRSLGRFRASLVVSALLN